MSLKGPIPFSILDLSSVREGEGADFAFRASLALARRAEELGFHRFWMAEHHNMEGIASAATSVALGYIAAGTSRIRVGAGGVMLPNHSPLVIAEQFGTLATLYPNRVDLGLGRAPGTDFATSQALRREMTLGGEDRFPSDVQELIEYFQPFRPQRVVRAIPGEGLQVPVFILGSSTYGARLAAFLGLPFAFASHFAPDHLFDALAIYRHEFRSSAGLEHPYAIVACNAVVAATDEEARFAFSSSQMGVLNLLRGKRGKLSPPIENIERIISEPEWVGIDRFLRYSFVGSPESVRDSLGDFLVQTGADELIFTSRVYDETVRHRSLELLMQVRDAIYGAAKVAQVCPV